MKAAILVEQKKPLVIADIDLPSKLGHGQVLVKVVCSGICGSQIGEIDGVKGPDRFLPHLLGHEGGGIVEETGPGVTKVNKGDHVVMHWRKGAGIESAPPKYKWNGKEINAGWVTTFNEKAVVSENRITAIPKEIDLEFAALLGCAITTGYGVIDNNAKLKRNESVVVIGAGGIGLNMIQKAVMIGACPIIAVDIYDHKLALAKKYGASHIINSKNTDTMKEVLRIAGDKGSDVVIDNTGNVKIIEMAYEMTAPKGRTILVGVPKKGEKISIYTLPLHFGRILTGSHGGESDPSKDIIKYIKLIKEHKVDEKLMISNRYTLDDINNAIKDLREGKVIKAIINM